MARPGRTKIGDHWRSGVLDGELNTNSGKIGQVCIDTDGLPRMKLRDGGAHEVVKTGASSFATVAASAPVTNTAAETAFDQIITILANALRVGSVIRIHAQGIATATNGTDELVISLRVGGLDIIVTDSVDVADNDIFVIDMTLVVRTIGTGGTMVASGTQALGVPSTANPEIGSLASAALNTVTPTVIDVTAEWDNADAGNSVRLDILTADISY